MCKKLTNKYFYKLRVALYHLSVVGLYRSSLYIPSSTLTQNEDENKLQLNAIL